MYMWGEVVGGAERASLPKMQVIVPFVLLLAFGEQVRGKKKCALVCVC